MSNAYNIPVQRFNVSTPAAKQKHFLHEPEVAFSFRVATEFMDEVEYVKTMNDLCSVRIQEFIDSRKIEDNKYYFLPFVFARKHKMIAKIAKITADETTIEQIIEEASKLSFNDEVELQCKRESLRYFNDELFYIEIHPDERSRGIRL